MTRLMLVGLLLLGFVAAGGIAQVSSLRIVAAQGASGGEMMAPDPAAIARGEAVFHDEVMCTRCHSLNGEGRGTAVELNGIGHRLDYFGRSGMSPTEVVAAAFRGAPSMVMVRQSMTDQQVADVAAYLTTLRAPLVWDTSFTKAEAVQGLSVWASAGCPTCHTVAGVGGMAEEIPLRGIREKQSQAVVEFKLVTIGAGPPGQGMRDAWAAVAESDRRSMLAFLYSLD